MSESSKDIKAALPPTQELTRPEDGYHEQKSAEESLTHPSFLARLFTQHLNKLIDRGSASPYKFKDLFPLGPEYEEAESRRFSQSVVSSAERRGSSVFKWPFFWDIYSTVTGEFLKGIFLNFLAGSTSIAFPIILRLFLFWLQDQSANKNTGYCLAGLLSLSTVLKAFLNSCSQTYLHSAGCNTTHKITYAIGDRVSRLNDGTQKGKIISMFTTEMRLVSGLTLTITELLVNPLLIIIYTGMIVYVIGWFGIIAPALVFLFLPLHTKLEAFYKNNLKIRFGLAEKRAKLFSELLDGIKGIKFYGWERILIDKIDKIRQQEKSRIILTQVGDSFSEGSVRTTPIFGTLMVLWLYPQIYKGEHLSFVDTYFLIGVIMLYVRPITLIMWNFGAYVNGMQALSRIELLVKSEEPEVILADGRVPVGSVELQAASFSWKNEAQLATHIHKKGSPEGSEKSEHPGGEQAVTEAFDENENLVLRDISLTILPGELVAIVGSVASGKSTLLLSLLSAVKRVSGTLKFNGTTAFVPQEPFLLNDTVQNNITFGLPFDERKFELAVELAQLGPDLEELPGRERTEIGERGINLSGGQKQRVAIARAIYADSDILIADDCLSALDAFVGKRVFEQVICGNFAAKTRIFVTHQLHYVEDERVSRVIYLKEGRIVAQGKCKDLLATNTEFTHFFQREKPQKEAGDFSGDLDMSIPEENFDRSPSFSQKRHQMSHEAASGDFDPRKGLIPVSVSDHWDSPIPAPKSLLTDIEGNKTSSKLVSRLTIDERKFSGRVPWKIYSKYLSAGGLWAPILCFTLYLLNSFLVQLANYWAGKWAQRGTYLGVSTDTGYGVVYVVIAVSLCITYILRSMTLGLFTAKSSYGIYGKLVTNVMRRPMRFFDTTPNGVILNRCSDDVSQVDFSLSLLLGGFLDSISLILVGIAIIMVILPYLIVVCIIIVAMVWWSFHRYLLTVVELRRLTTLAMSPVMNRISECLSGAVVLRAYGQTGWLRKKFEKSIEVLTSTHLHDRLAIPWINFRLEIAIGLLGTMVSFLIAYFKAHSIMMGSEGVGSATATLYATLLANSFSIGGNIGYLIMSLGEVTKGMGSVQRLVEYSEHTDLEPDWDLPAPPPAWPAHGAVSFRRLSARYRAGLPHVLQSFSCDILPRQKVGIVGRTGSGKSSLLLCLLRMLYEGDTQAQDGRSDRGENKDQDTDSESGIFIDGVRIDRVGLHHLRRAVAVIPQDPMLLHGTVASNVDPLASADPDAVLRSLQQVQFFDTVKAEDVVAQRLRRLAATLGRDPTDAEATAEKERPVTDGEKMALEVEGKGANLSLGQRQLICISRCLIRKPKILLMDEATANVDQKTDAIIQRVVKRDLPDATVITIAHRLLTIAQYDKVVVLAKGEKVEEGRPGELLEKKGEFEKLVAEGGPDFVQKMKKLAENHELEICEV